MDIAFNTLILAVAGSIIFLTIWLARKRISDLEEERDRLEARLYCENKLRGKCREEVREFKMQPKKISDFLLYIPKRIELIGYVFGESGEYTLGNIKLIQRGQTRYDYEIIKNSIPISKSRYGYIVDTVCCYSHSLSFYIEYYENIDPQSITGLDSLQPLQCTRKDRAQRRIDFQAKLKAAYDSVGR